MCKLSTRPIIAHLTNQIFSYFILIVQMGWMSSDFCHENHEFHKNSTCSGHTEQVLIINFLNIYLPLSHRLTDSGRMVSSTTRTSSPVSASRSVSLRAAAEKLARACSALYFQR